MALSNDEIADYVEDLDKRIDKLRVAYEQYFMGFEKIEPMRGREDLQRRITVLLRENIRNTALRFKFGQVQARFGTYVGYWQRICKQIENGTYERHLRKATAKEAAKALKPLPERADPASWELPPSMNGDDLDGMFDAIRRPDSLRRPSVRPTAPADEWDEKTDPNMTFPTEPPPAIAAAVDPRFAAPPLPRPAAPPLPRAPAAAPPLPRPVATAPPLPRPAAPAPPAPVARPAAAPAPAARPPAGPISDARVRELFDKLVAAKQARREPTANLTVEAVAKSVRDSQAKLEAQHKGRRVDFEVTEKDGKTILRPIVK